MKLTEKALQRILLFGTGGFLVALVAMTADSLGKVKSGRTPALTAQVVAGKRVWNRNNCNDCHTILGIGGYYAPDLTKIADVRDADWLRRWFIDPGTVKPGTTMPNQALASLDATNLVAFFRWVAGIDTNQWPPAPRTGGAATGGASRGALLFQQKGCAACHQIGGQGAGGPGPDLSRIGSEPYDALPNTRGFLARWLDDPAAQKPGTLMPRTPLTPTERDALVEYLAGLT